MSTSGIHSDNIKHNICNYCNIKLSNRQSRWRHEQKCIKKNNNVIENDLLKKELTKIKSQLANILKHGKIHPKTLQKINKQLVNGNINNGNINNTTINNTYVKFGAVGFEKVLNNNQILSILNKQCLSLEEAIKLIHFNDDLPEYNNIYITNMKDNLAYIFDGNKFISVKKNDIIADMIENYAYEIELSFDNNKNKLRDTISKRIERFLKLINNDDKYTDVHNKTYPNFKAYKIGDIKRLIYNYSDQKKLTELNKL
jgi:rubrerythrin